MIMFDELQCLFTKDFSQTKQYKILPLFWKCSFRNSKTYFATFSVFDNHTFGMIKVIIRNTYITVLHV